MQPGQNPVAIQVVASEFSKFRTILVVCLGVLAMAGKDSAWFYAGALVLFERGVSVICHTVLAAKALSPPQDQRMGERDGRRDG